MRIEKFRVQGYKNLTDELVMDGLRGYNVIHGVNNIGKSNLLEAMSLLMQPSKTLSKDATPLIGKYEMKIEGFIPGLFKPLTDSDLTPFPPWQKDEVTQNLAYWKENRWCFVKDQKSLNGSHFTGLSSHTSERLGAQRTGPMTNERFMLIPVSRALNEKLVINQERESTLALEMYDAQQSEDISNVKRWRAFVDAMKDFQDITGPGEFVATYQRATDEAQLMFEMHDARIPFRLLGTGMQQIVQLLGMILMSNASIIAIEEPELNLRWALQTRLAGTLRRLLGKPDAGIDQFFITTHSPAFSDEPDFWLMRKGEHGPIIERRPSRDLPLVLNDNLEELPSLPKHEIDAWLTPEGVVKVPKFVQAQLHLEHGGALIFRDAPDGVLMQNETIALSNAGLLQTHANHAEPAHAD
jgi:hypothetical protein